MTSIRFGSQLHSNGAKADLIRETSGQRHSDEVRRRDFAIGSADHLVDVIGRDTELGVDHIIFKACPTGPPSTSA